MCTRLASDVPTTSEISRRALVRGSHRLGTMPARSIDTATIAFGLVSIPVKVYSTNEPSHEIHFNLIHAGCGERLKQQYVCPKHGEIERSEMSKGFELTKGNFVELSKEELKNLEAVASDEIAIREFVPLSAVDPLMIDASYYLGPGKGGDRAYRLLRDALEDAGLAGIAAYAARGKEYVVMVRPFEDGLVMHQLRYPDEIKAWSEVPLSKLPKPTSSELGLASKIIDQLTHEKFSPEQYKDTVKLRVRKLIAEKAKGGEITAPPEAPRPEVTDLMAALKASLEGGAASKSHAPRVTTARARTKRSRPAAARPHARAKAAAKRARAHR
jgi:DNA end-binding protein Ku